MRFPRSSIASLMLVVGVCAFDCLIWRDESWSLLPSTGTEPYVWLFVPMMSALVIGVFVVCAQVLQRHECRPGLLGFEVFGSAEMLALALVYVVNHWRLDPYCDAVKLTLDRLFRVSRLIQTGGDYYTPFLHDWAVPAIVCVTMIIPQFAFALLGGWLFRRFGVAVVRR
jgi:hypothetical protein